MKGGLSNRLQEKKQEISDFLSGDLHIDSSADLPSHAREISNNMFAYGSLSVCFIQGGAYDFAKINNSSNPYKKRLPKKEDRRAISDLDILFCEPGISLKDESHIRQRLKKDLLLGEDFPDDNIEIYNKDNFYIHVKDHRLNLDITIFDLNAPPNSQTWIASSKSTKLQIFPDGGIREFLEPAFETYLQNNPGEKERYERGELILDVQARKLGTRCAYYLAKGDFNIDEVRREFKGITNPSHIEMLLKELNYLYPAYDEKSYSEYGEAIIDDFKYSIDRTMMKYEIEGDKDKKAFLQSLLDIANFDLNTSLNPNLDLIRQRFLRDSIEAMQKEFTVKDAVKDAEEKLIQDLLNSAVDELQKEKLQKRDTEEERKSKDQSLILGLRQQGVIATEEKTITTKKTEVRSKPANDLSVLYKTLDEVGCKNSRNKAQKRLVLIDKLRLKAKKEPVKYDSYRVIEKFESDAANSSNNVDIASKSSGEDDFEIYYRKIISEIEEETKTTPPVEENKNTTQELQDSAESVLQEIIRDASRRVAKCAREVRTQIIDEEINIVSKEIFEEFEKSKRNIATDIVEEVVYNSFLIASTNQQRKAASKSLYSLSDPNEEETQEIKNMVDSCQQGNFEIVYDIAKNPDKKDLLNRKIIIISFNQRISLSLISVIIVLGKEGDVSDEEKKQYDEEKNKLLEFLINENLGGVNYIDNLTNNTGTSLERLPLHAAINEKNTQITSLLLDKTNPVLIDARFHHGFSPFQHIASEAISCKTNDDYLKTLELLELCLNKGFDPTINFFGKKSIVEVLGFDEKFGKFEEGVEIIDRILDLHDEKKHKRTLGAAFIAACGSKNNDFALKILEKFPSILNSVDKFGLSAFSMACSNENVKMMEVMLDKGVNVNSQIIGGGNAIGILCNGSEKMMPFLVRCFGYASQDENNKEIAKNIKSSKWISSFKIQCNQHLLELCQKRSKDNLKNAKNILSFFSGTSDIKVDGDLRSMIDFAFKSSNLEVIEFLLERKIEGLNSKEGFDSTKYKKYLQDRLGTEGGCWNKFFKMLAKNLDSYESNIDDRNKYNKIFNLLAKGEEKQGDIVQYAVKYGASAEVIDKISSVSKSTSSFTAETVNKATTKQPSN